MAYTDINLGLKASADVLAGQVLEVTGDETVGVATAGSTKVIGVAFGDAKSGEPVAVSTEGLFSLVAGGAINAGDYVEADGNGGVVAQATFDASKAVGKAINSAANAGDKVKVLLL